MILVCPLCRHCSKGTVNRPRGLCWQCYYTPGLKERYPSTSKYAHRGVGGGDADRPMPPEPTDTQPGSAERLAVLEERARNGFGLWHPEDRR